MFSDWKEYRDYLTQHLITIPENRSRFVKQWARMDEVYDLMDRQQDLIKKQIGSLLVNDWEFVKLAGFINSPAMITYRDWKKGKLGARSRADSHMIYIRQEYL